MVSLDRELQVEHMGVIVSIFDPASFQERLLEAGVAFADEDSFLSV